MAKVWEAYPSGGIEGNYVLIGAADEEGTRYNWNKYKRQWLNAAGIPETTAREMLEADGDVFIQNNLTVGGALRAKRIKQPCMGLFASLAALEAKWPDPEVGMWALVGDSVSITSPAAVYRCDTEGTWAATGGTAYIDGLEINVANGITGWVPISDTSQLPSDPTPEQQERGYLLGTMLYVYVGTGGDTLSGKYQSAQLKGLKGDKGDKGDNAIVLPGEYSAYIADNLNTNDSEKILSAKQGYNIGQDLYDVHGVVSPNTAIASQSSTYATQKIIANNLTTTDWIEGINIVLNNSTTLSVYVFDVVKRYIVEELSTDSYSAGTHNIMFDDLVKLGTNQFIAVGSQKLNYANSGGVGCYFDGVLINEGTSYDENKEASYELLTVAKKIKSKITDLEGVTSNLPTIEADVLGASGKYVSPTTPIESMNKNMKNTTKYAPRLFTNKKVLGIRVFCYRAGEIEIGVYNREAGTYSSVKTASTSQFFNTILFDTPFYLKPSELIAVGSTSSNNYCLNYADSGDVGYYNSGTGEYVSGRAISIELIVEDDGLVGNVARLNKLQTNKSWCSVGTSITHANKNVPSTAVNLLRGYQDRVRDKIDFTNFYNVGVAGQAIATGARSGPVGCLAANVDAVLTAVADYYTIEHGINDWYRCASIGTIDDFINNTGYTTFYGAWRIVIDKIYTLNPNAQIILITPRKAYGTTGTATSGLPSHWYDANTENSVDYYLKDYVDAVKAIAQFLSLPVCDWFGESNTNQYNLAANSVDAALHPNDTGYQKLANLLVQTFKKVID